ncbi:MAG TPA: ABC transporter substrate-binding protein [Verrucomicrobiae bacterium]
MKTPRILSLLPAATEMVYALGLEDALVGVSHECDYPSAARSKPVVVQPVLPLATMSLREIDTAVAARIGSGQSLYQIDEALVRSLQPDLILTQDLCQVCGPAGNEITAALKALPSRPQILWFTPHRLADIWQNVRELGQATGQTARAEAWVNATRRRLEAIKARRPATTPRPRVFFLEWADPYYCGGHWVPEMIELAGGMDALGRTGTHSIRIGWTEIAAWAPEILVISPCGFGTDQAYEQAINLLREPGWRDLPAVREGRVYAVNANAYFARPGPRLVTGVELLAHLIHPKLYDWQGPAAAWRQVPVAAVPTRPARTKGCTRCGISFTCGPGEPGGRCWCDDLPPLAPRPGDDCLCPTCLSRAGLPLPETRP